MIKIYDSYICIKVCEVTNDAFLIRKMKTRGVTKELLKRGLLHGYAPVREQPCMYYNVLS